MSENSDVARILIAIADLLDLAGEKFKPEAYRRAARSVESLPEPLAGIARRGGLQQIPGVGEAIAEKIQEFLREGRIGYYDRLLHEFPAGLIDLMQLPGIGPKTARRFWTELGIEGPAELATAIDAGRLSGVKGFGPRKIELFRAALAHQATGSKRLPLATADGLAREIIDALRNAASLEEIEVAGSLRRRRETVGDLDILVTATDAATVLAAFPKLPHVERVLLAGGTKVTIIYRGGVQVDLRVVEPKSFGAALQYFTGSKDHNIHLRTIARDRGLKINEYGVFRGEEWVSGRTEAEVYEALGLSWMPPEIRENQGEIEAALRHEVPTLVTPEHLRGLLHVHLTPDAAAATIDRILLAAEARHWEYLGFVVAETGNHTHPTPISEPARTHLEAYRKAGSSSPVRVLLAVEGPVVPETALAAGTDYWILNLGAALERGEKPAPEAPAPWVMAHPPASSSSGIPGFPFLPSPHGPPAIEVTSEPGRGGFDSATVHEWLGRGGFVGVAAGGDDPLDERRLSLAMGVARRGWTVPGQLLNSRTAAHLNDGRPSRPPRVPPKRPRK